MANHRASPNRTYQIYLDKHRGSSEGKKPTVKLVRERVKEWKSMISKAESFLHKQEELKRFAS